MKKHGALLIIICLVSLISAPAFSETKKQKARRLFDEGVAALADHNYKKALEVFEEAYQTSPHWMVLAHIGTCNAKLARPVEAIEALEQFLLEGGSDIPAEERHSARKLLMEEQKKVGQLFLVVQYPNADVKVDGETVDGPPFERITLKAGVHHILVVVGSAVMEKDVTIQARREHTIKFSDDPEDDQPVMTAPPVVAEEQHSQPPVMEPRQETAPTQDTGPNANADRVDITSEVGMPNGPSAPFWVAIGFAGAGVITAGVGWGLYPYYAQSEQNYADRIENVVEIYDEIDFSWADTCNSGQSDGGSIPVPGDPDGPEIYYCETERDRRNFEKSSNNALITGIVGTAVTATSLTLAITFYLHPEWFSSSSERAKLRISPVAGSTFSGLAISGDF